MRRTVEALCARVPLDGRSRRALDETLSDCAYEADAARTHLEFALASARSVAALARTLVAVFADEFARIPAAPVAARLLLVLLVPIVLLAITGWGHVPWRGDVTVAQRITLAIYGTPQAGLALLPLGLFTIALTHARRGSFPSLGLAGAALLTSLIAAAWLLPAGSKSFHETVNSLHSPVARSAMSVGPPDMGPLDLARNAAARPMGPAMGVLLFRLGLALMSGAFVVLGSIAAGLPTARRRICAAAVISSYALTVLVLPSTWELGGHAPAFVGLLPWGAAALALALAFTIGNPAPAEGVER